MKGIIALFAVLILVVICHGMAVAAPAPSNVNVVNTSANPVPVTQSTRVLYSATNPPDNQPPVLLDASQCSSIRIAVKGLESAGFIGLVDDATGASLLGLAGEAEGPGIKEPGPDFTKLIDATFTNVWFEIDVDANASVKVVVYCR